MNNEDAEARTVQPRSLKRYEWSLAAGWTFVIVALIVVNVYSDRKKTLETARTQARSSYQRDVIYRHWVAGLGGVYVPITKDTQPNPYMADVPGRDVTTTTGEKLTLVNPAYLTRLVFDLSAEVYNVKGHITSMRPVRPNNRPDKWETSAFAAFARGEKEVSSVDKIGGESYLRLMTPLMTDQECLKCHAKDGYREGEIRGGISVAVPMQPLWMISGQNIILSTISFTILWLAGLSGIFAGATRLRLTIQQRDKAEQKIITLNHNLSAQTKELENANHELEAFNYTAAHDLRGPLNNIGLYFQTIQQLYGAKLDETCCKYLTAGYKNVQRMSQLIDVLLEFSKLSKVEPHRENIDLSVVVREITDELKSTSPERRCVFSIADGVIVNGDPKLLRVALDNLLRNAWKYTGNKEETVIEFGATEINGKLAYFVRDNGKGFDMADTGKLFIPFQRLPGAEEFKGFGIGLATVERIILRHGGRIWAEGEPGKGATFYFTL